MATEKDLNQTGFTKIAKEIDAYAEMIKSQQNQKQVLLNDFDKECERYKAGKISKVSLMASIPRVRKEIKKTDDSIRNAIRNLNKTADRAKDFARRQMPKSFKISLSGTALAGGKKKAVHRKVRHAKKN